MNSRNLARRAVRRLVGMTMHERVTRIEQLLSAPVWDTHQPRILALLDIARQRKIAHERC